MYFEKHGNGQPVVFLHGWGCDGSIFLPVVNRLLNFANYLVDFNGFGKSNPPPESGWTVVDYAEQLVEFLQEQQLSNVTIVGHSFGCRVALVLAANHPELVNRMLLVAPAGLRRFSLSRWWKVTKYKLSKFFAKLRGIAVKAKYASEDYANCSPAMRNTFVKVINQDLSLYAKRVACPVLIVNGREDTATPLSHAKRMHRLIQHSSLVEIDGDHFALFRNPKAFADTVKNFVE
ncbi:MAG: alpha/beta hydrolase [Clostridiales bacterium]|nr:alpha/beta hydrolase [Clostridiales bacterium]